MKCKSSISNPTLHCYLSVLVVMGEEEYWKSSVNLYIFILSSPSVCMPCAGEKFGKQLECSPDGTVVQPDQLVKLLSVGWDWHVDGSELN